MKTSFDITKTNRVIAGHQPPFGKGKAENGQVSFSLLQEERDAVEALVQAYQQFTELIQHQQPSKLVNEFVEGIHRMQLSVGALRFYHISNQESRINRGSNVKTVMTSDKTLTALSQWRKDYEQQLRLNRYPKSHRDIMEALLKAWDHMMVLTQAYPDQHNYDDFKEGLLQCEEVLHQLRDPSLVNTSLSKKGRKTAS